MRDKKKTGKSKPAVSKVRKHGTTRDEIIEAGLRLFSEKGFDGVSVKDLESAVGLRAGSGSFYRHFDSKEALLEQIVHREVEKIRQIRDLQQRGVSGTLGNRRAELIVEYRLTLLGLEQMRTFINLLGREYGRFPELMQDLYQSLVEESLAMGAKDLQHDIDQKQIRAKDPEALAAVVQSALVGFHLSKTYFGNQPYGVDNDRFAKALADMLVVE